MFHCVWEERTGPVSDFKPGLKVNFASRADAAWHGKRNLGQQVLEVAVLGFKDFDTAEAAFTRQLEKLVLVQRAEKRNQKPESTLKAGSEVSIGVRRDNAS